MLKRAPLFLALRYLRPKRSFVSVITIISILGVMVGVLMMVVVRSVMQGFEMDLRETLMGSEPHVLITKKAGAAGATPWEELLKTARGGGALAAVPVAGGLLYAADAEAGFQTLGVAPREAVSYLEKLRKHLLDGDLDLRDGTVVISDSHANYLGVGVGDELSVYPSQNVNEMVRKFRAANDEDDKAKKKAAYEKIKLHPRKVTISGILRSETAGGNAYVSLKTGQDIFGLGSDITAIAVELKEPNRAEEFASAVKPAAKEWEFHLWTDTHKSKLAAMSNEQIMMMLVLLTIALVGAFSVMNTTITVTMQKRREIGVITALGARKGQIVQIFLNQSIIVGIIGTSAGLAASLLVLKFRNDIADLVISIIGSRVIEGVFFSTIPAHTNALDVALICAASMALCVVAGWLPAWFAARVDPAVALRD